MHINAVCPLCHTRYQLDPSLLGQAIRCPNSVCRHVFVVSEETPPAAGDGGAASPRPKGGSPNGGSRSGTVAEFVPVLPAEAAHETALDAEPADADRGSGHVGDFLPIAEAEPADRPREVPSWHQPPPVRRPGAPGDPPAANTPEARPRKNRRTGIPADAPAPTEAELPAAPPPDDPTSLIEVPPGTWDTPPPVRQPAAGLPAPKRPPPRGARWALRIVVAAVIFTVVVLGAGYGIYVNVVANNEEHTSRKARAAVEREQYGAAVTPLRELTEKFESSADIEEYRYLLEMSQTLADLGTGTGGEAGLDRLRGFVEGHRKNPFLQTYGRHLGKAAVRLLTEVNDEGKRDPRENTPDVLAKSDQTLGVFDSVKGAVTGDERDRVKKGFAEVSQAVAVWKDLMARAEQVAVVAGNDQALPADRIKLVRQIARLAEQRHPGFAARPDVTGALEKLFDKHRASVHYEAVGQVLPPPDRPDPRLPPGVVFEPRVDAGADGASRSRAGDPVVLALARGVLYALARSDGKVLWVRRVGLDTRNLPERVPPSATFPGGLVLVQSADTAAVTALNAADGSEVWRYQLESPCLGRPVVIDQRDARGRRDSLRVLLPTYGGYVHELEVAGGRLLGRYHLGSRLTVGGVREGKPREDPGAKERGEDPFYEVVYFPADDFCVYALDVTRHRCEAILYTDHPSGSLRGVPVVVPPETQAVAGNVQQLPGVLVLNQTDGLDAVRLRAFELPLKDRFGPPLAPEPRMPGWTWFQPAHDPEKIVLVSDAGLLHVVGIKSANTLDTPLFPLTHRPVDLAPLLDPEGDERGTAQVVHAQGNDFWVLARGKLQRVQLAWRPQGPTPAAAWEQPLSLGSPLHAAQVLEDRAAGRNVLVVVTQKPDRQTCLATAVDDEDGRVLWQRQLGLVCQGEPAALRRPGGSPVTAALGQGGEVAALDPDDFKDVRGVRWYSEFNKPAADASAGAVDVPRLVPAADGRSAYAVTCLPGPGRKFRLVVRHLGFGPEGGRPVVTRTQEFPVDAPPAGAPALLAGRAGGADASLLVLLADGNLVALSLGEGDKVAGGPTWRSPRVGPEGRGYVAALGGDRFLTADATDPAHGLRCWRWTERGAVLVQPPNADAEGRDVSPPTYPLSERLAGAPLVVPPWTGRKAPLVCYADAAGVVRILRVADGGWLEDTDRRWDLHGPVTAGPFLREGPGGGQRVGCVVGGGRLVWIDPDPPARDGLLWQYPAGGKAGDPVVGEPRLAGGVLVLADLSGRYVGLDPATGKPVGEGYILSGSVGPACGPVPFDGARALAPLSDGTALLLPMRLFGGGAARGPWWLPPGAAP